MESKLLIESFCLLKEKLMKKTIFFFCGGPREKGFTRSKIYFPDLFFIIVSEYEYISIWIALDISDTIPKVEISNGSTGKTVRSFSSNVAQICVFLVSLLIFRAREEGSKR